MRKAICILLLFCTLLAFGPGSAFGAEKQGVTFNFVDVELSAVAKFVSDVTGKNFIFDERLKGKITIIAPSKLSPKDAFSLFTSVLDMKGLTLVPSGVNAYKIVPVAEAKQSGVAFSGARPPMDESFVVRLVPLDYISSDEALKFLKPVVSRSGHISSFGPGNMLLVVDSGLNMEKVLGIIKGIDKATLTEEPEVVFLEYSSAETIASIVNEGIERKRVKKSDEVLTKVVADQRLNAVVLFGSRADRESMKRLIKLLDVEERKALSTINVFFLENADAEELAEVLANLLKGQRTTTKKPKGGKETTSPFEAVSGISITPDKATNSLVVVASPADFQSISRVIKQLDKRRKQVFVEAMIVEASIDKVKDLGSRWRASITHDGEPLVIGGVGTIDDSTLDTVLTGLSGFTLGGVGNFLEIPTLEGETLTVPGFAALFSLSEFEGAVNVLSSPQILTSDNSEAEILVGENVPFISQRERDATTDDTVLNSIERKDVGITLRITPQITEGDYVKLDIYQEISAVQEVSEDIFTSVGPTTTKRSTSTTVVVRDNQTVVIGGLMEEKEEKSVTKMPLLGDIPVLGWLFKFKTTSKEKTNLLVFLTPHIIKNSEDIGRITRTKKGRYLKEANVYAKGELLVKFNRSVTDDMAIDIISRENAVFIEFMAEPGHYHLRLPEDMSVEEGIERFTGLAEVVYAKPNYGLPDMSLLSAGASMGEKSEYVEGEVLVRFKADVEDARAREIIEERGGTVLRQYKGLGIYLIGLKKGQSVEEGVDVFGSLPEVEYAEPNYIKTMKK
jgi:general secretion pathway protein D